MGDIMARADWNNERKTAARQYDNIHYSVIGCKLPRSTADQFRTLCKDQGISVSAALSQYVRAALAAGTLDIISNDIPWTRDDDGTTAAGSIQDNDGRRDDIPGQKNIDPAFQQGDQANENDTHGAVDLPTANETPGTVDIPENASD